MNKSKTKSSSCGKVRMSACVKRNGASSTLAVKYLYQLRHAEKVGMKLAEQGYTLENIEELMLADMESEE